MSSRRPRTLLSAIGLVALALVAGGLSAAALLQSNPIAATPAPVYTSAITAPTSSPITQETVPSSALSSSPESTLDDSIPPHNASKVVIIGDVYSDISAPNLWTLTVAEELEWSPVVNISDPGRGYVRAPSSCDIYACSNFRGTISTVAEHNPDIVVTFGGTADGDNDLSTAASEYFAALREALPAAELIAISPVTSEDEVPYFLRLHDQTISAAVEAVDGIFIDVGQPGVGDGEQLSAEAQDEVAQAIIEELS